MTSDQGPYDPRVEPRFDDDGAHSINVDPYDRPVADPRRTARRRILAAVVVLAAFGGFAGIAWYATSEGQKDPSAVVPVITADGAPIKERPAEPGGLDVPNRDVQVFNRITPTNQPQKVEQLLPPAETPVARPAPEPPSISSAKVPEAPAIQGRNGVPAPPAEITPPPPVTPPVMGSEAPAPAPKSSSTAPQAPPERAAPKQAAPPQAAAAATGAWRVQLGASREEARARAALATIVKSNTDLLGSIPSEVVRADLGAKGVYWRMRAGSFPDRAGADALCKRLADRKVSCSIVRP